jgi:DMSO/TMAO reductase YedYZ molybdopterin-dependent catalytic subunit
MKKLFGLVTLVIIAAMFVGCAPTPAATTEAPVVVPPTVEPTLAPTVAPTEAPTTAPAATAGPLEIKGLVSAPQTLTLDQLKALAVVTKSIETPKSGTVEFTGVLLSELLALAQVNSTATTLVFTASDGYSAQVDLAAVSACADCMVAFTTDNGLYSVMPGHAGKAWVKNLVTIEIQ